MKLKMAANCNAYCGAAPGIKGKSPQPPYGFRIAIALVCCRRRGLGMKSPPGCPKKINAKCPET